LRFGKKEIKSPYLVNSADYIACHNQSYVNKYNLLASLKPGGKFVLNCQWSAEELEEKLPGSLKKDIYEKKAKFYIIDAVKIAHSLGLGGRINMIMQSAFFKLANVIPLEDAVKYLKESVVKTYGKKGQEIVDMNNKAVDAGCDALIEVKVRIPGRRLTKIRESSLAVTVIQLSLKTLSALCLPRRETNCRLVLLKALRTEHSPLAQRRLKKGHSNRSAEVD
jgi:Pyruvate/2-oxoacid:ferredoxin oxidoreductase gamma subunit